jgi:hemerythrin superfamily protein
MHMPKSTKRKSTRSTSFAGAKRRAASPRQGARSSRTDAIQLLKADHRQVEQWFEQFEKSRSDDKKRELAQNICKALTVHAQIEEEIFYPAFLEATDDTDMHHEAEVEHDGAKKLIAQIEGSGPEDDYFDARVTVLSEMIKHHVKEEEQRDGMFAKARKSDMDLAELGERLMARKEELMAAGAARGTAAMGMRRGRGRRGETRPAA